MNEKLLTALLATALICGGCGSDDNDDNDGGEKIGRAHV